MTFGFCVARLVLAFLVWRVGRFTWSSLVQRLLLRLDVSHLPPPTHHYLPPNRFGRTRSWLFCFVRLCVCCFVYGIHVALPYLPTYPSSFVCCLRLRLLPTVRWDVVAFWHIRATLFLVLVRRYYLPLPTILITFGLVPFGFFFSYRLCIPVRLFGFGWVRFDALFLTFERFSHHATFVCVLFVCCACVCLRSVILPFVCLFSLLRARFCFAFAAFVRFSVLRYTLPLLFVYWFIRLCIRCCCLFVAFTFPLPSGLRLFKTSFSSFHSIPVPSLPPYAKFWFGFDPSPSSLLSSSPTYHPSTTTVHFYSRGSVHVPFPNHRFYPTPTYTFPLLYHGFGCCILNTTTPTTCVRFCFAWLAFLLPPSTIHFYLRFVRGGFAFVLFAFCFCSSPTTYYTYPHRSIGSFVRSILPILFAFDLLR